MLRFIHQAMNPVRYADTPALFDERRARLNVALAFASLYLQQDGRLSATPAATTLPEARRRAQRLKGTLGDRGAHPRLLAACVAEIDDESYFHAVFEAAKSLAHEIRQRTGSQLDDVALVRDTLEITNAHPAPLLALNRLETQTERSRQQGLAAGVRAIFSAARNPTAHEPKVLSTLTERDAINILTQISYLHRRLDECFDTGHLRATPTG